MLVIQFFSNHCGSQTKPSVSRWWPQATRFGILKTVPLSHCTDEKTEAQGAGGICQKWHSQDQNPSPNCPLLFSSVLSPLLFLLLCLSLSLPVSLWCLSLLSVCLFQSLSLSPILSRVSRFNSVIRYLSASLCPLHERSLRQQTFGAGCRSDPTSAPQAPARASSPPPPPAPPPPQISGGAGGRGTHGAGCRQRPFPASATPPR